MKGFMILFTSVHWLLTTTNALNNSGNLFYDTYSNIYEYGKEMKTYQI